MERKHEQIRLDTILNVRPIFEENKCKIELQPHDIKIQSTAKELHIIKTLTKVGEEGPLEWAFQNSTQEPDRNELVKPTSVEAEIYRETAKKMKREHKLINPDTIWYVRMLSVDSNCEIEYKPSEIQIQSTRKESDRTNEILKRKLVGEEGHLEPVFQESTQEDTQISNEFPLTYYANTKEPDLKIRRKAVNWLSFIKVGDEDMANHLIEQRIVPNNDELQRIFATCSLQTTILKRICRLIEERWIETSNNIDDITASYKPDKPNEIGFVVFPANGKQFELNDKFQYPFIIYRQSNQEANEIIDLEVCSHLHFDEMLMTILSENLRNESPGLMDKHSNLNMTSASHFKSTSYGCENIRKKSTCIIFYVSAKGFIPVGEDILPSKIGPFQTDVREGRFQLTVGGGPGKKHTNVKTGCQISSNGQDGTIGGFVEHPKFGLCAMTCAHVLLTGDEFKKLYEEGDVKLMSRGQHCPNRSDAEWASRICYQPEEPDEIGKLVDAIAYPGNKKNSGIDIAFVKIDNSRVPLTGEFPDSKWRKPTCSCVHTKDTFIEHQLKYKNGTVFSRKQIPSTNTVFKYGATTKFTTGTLQVHGSSIRTEIDLQGWQNKTAAEKPKNIYKYTLHDQINIFSCGENFSEKGDSGALVMSLFEGNVPVAFGILVGGGIDCKVSFATPLSNILKQIGMTSPYSLVQLNNERRFQHLSDKIDRVNESFKEILEKLQSRGQCHENE